MYSACINWLWKSIKYNNEICIMLYFDIKYHKILAKEIRLLDNIFACTSVNIIMFSEF